MKGRAWPSALARIHINHSFKTFHSTQESALVDTWSSVEGIIISQYHGTSRNMADRGLVNLTPEAACPY